MKHFKLEEFDCPCCSTNYMDHTFLQMLDIAREISGVSFIVNSGYRCEKHNADPKVGGSPTSSHLLGLAADIKCTTDAKRGRILHALYKAGFTRTGVYPTFIHVDNDLAKPQFRVWLKKEAK